MASAYNDSTDSAPAGTPQPPTLFGGDASRSRWNVAGVDYAAGVPIGTPTWTLDDGGVATDTGSSTLSFAYNLRHEQKTSAFDAAAVVVDVNGSTITGGVGGVGNTSNVSISGLVQTGSQTDTTAPTISSITETPSNGELAVGAQATLSLTFSEPVTVAGGTPTLTLDSGGTATYSGGSGSSTLSFTYTVGAGQNTTALAATAVNLNGATISDSAGTEANLSLAGVAQDAPTIDTYNDGSAKAPAGTPQLPNLLAGLVAPPWQVAGVNYAVGVPSGTTLLNPATISMAGVSVNTSSEIITITGSNVTLNGYNFGLGNGWSIAIASGATNTVIENSSFVLGSNENVPIDVPSGGNVTILDNTFNGDSTTNGNAWAMINYDGSGTITAEYNIFENTPSDAIDFGNGNMTTIVEYNLFENLGTSPGTHADTVQYDGSDSTNTVIAFNTVTSGEEGIQLDAQGGGSTMTNSTIDNNVVVAPVTSSVVITFSIAVQQWSGNTINGVVVDDNYLDYAGSYGPFYTPTGSNLTYTGNVNMSTGALIASPTGTSVNRRHQRHRLSRQRHGGGRIHHRDQSAYGRGRVRHRHADPDVERRRHRHLRQRFGHQHASFLLYGCQHR